MGWAFCTQNNNSGNKNKAENPVLSDLAEAIAEISEAVSKLQEAGKDQSSKRKVGKSCLVGDQPESLAGVPAINHFAF